MEFSLTSKNAALMFLDFEAAFPSLSHDFMWKVLEHFQLPPGLIHAIQSLYQGNQHYIKAKGGIYKAFTATGGVRQGCPLSPLLFAIVADVLLRKLVDTFPGPGQGLR